MNRCNAEDDPYPVLGNLDRCRHLDLVCGSLDQCSGLGSNNLNQNKDVDPGLVSDNLVDCNGSGCPGLVWDNLDQYMSPDQVLDHNLNQNRALASDNLNQCSHQGSAYPDSLVRHMNQVWADSYRQCKLAALDRLVHSLVLHNVPGYLDRNLDQYRRLDGLVHSSASSLVCLNDSRVPRTSLSHIHFVLDCSYLIYKNIHYFHKSILSDSHVTVRTSHLELSNRSAGHNLAHFP